MVDCAARMERLAGWIEPIRYHDVNAALGRLIGQLPTELAKPGIADRPRQASVFDHAGHVQILNHHHRWHLLGRLGFRLHQGCSGFVEGITTDVCDAIMRSGKLPLRFLSVLTAFVSAGKPTLGAAHLVECRSQRLWIGDDAPVADRCQDLDAEVYADGCAAGRDEPYTVPRPEHSQTSAPPFPIPLPTAHVRWLANTRVL